MTSPFRKPTSTPAEDAVDIERYLDGVAAFFGGTANVIMQLSALPVGYGVLESTVDSGKVMLHPIKRLRTTLTYLAVAMLGTDDERDLYREAVNLSHHSVKSTAASPVKYNAFDPALQLWVAACLYWGACDLYERMHRPMHDAEAFYRYGSRFGTTLQMRPEMWPADRAAFDEYWTEHLAKTTIDPPIRDYFNDLIDLKMLPRAARIPFARFQRFVVTGLLPEHLRDQMGMTWTADDDRKLARIMHITGSITARMPKQVRMFPINAYLWDMRIRRRFGLRLV
ncbi:oxygenase MpaB family protein [Nocardia sp. CA-135953]|uniref:oxygenase MpaB family protein n=1 Tax=Nocardia sp. CA-135953 TaxID=3239978 RepID=UPI003D969440